MSIIETTPAIFETDESTVRSYSRSFPAVFARAKGEWLFTEHGERYLDFLSGAGSLNYGHNPDTVTRGLIAYLENDGLVHGLDLATSAKADFLATFQRYVLTPLGLDYKIQFCNPSGANAVEAALKLARIVTGRGNIVSFSGGFHGMTTSALAATGADHFKQGLRPWLPAVTHLPYPDSPLGHFDSLDLLRRLVEDPSSGVEKPAAIIIETVQGEGGVYLAPAPFLRELRAFCDEHQILLIVDDIQVGCGRTGHFFSFEPAGIEPDLVTLAKSIGGVGLPMAILLIKPEFDVWQPGQHSGTFRGNQLAFTAGAAVLRQFWADGGFAADVRVKGETIAEHLNRRLTSPFGLPVRGKGLIWGIDLDGVPGPAATEASQHCFRKGLIAETCGRRSSVLKILPPLTISSENLIFGLDIVADAVGEVVGERP